MMPMPDEGRRLMDRAAAIPEPVYEDLPPRADGDDEDGIYEGALPQIGPLAIIAAAFVMWLASVIVCAAIVLIFVRFGV